MKSKRSTDEWKELVDNYRDSGLSNNKYCIENNLKPSTFIYWIKKFNNSKQKNSNNFVKISVPAETCRRMKLSFNQISLEFPVELSAEKISKLITVLKEI